MDGVFRYVRYVHNFRTPKASRLYAFLRQRIPHHVSPVSHQACTYWPFVLEQAVIILLFPSIHNPRIPFHRCTASLNYP